MKMYGRFERPTETSIKSEGQIYGAIPDERGPIGGGEGYKQFVTEGDFRVSNLDQLLNALEKAQTGQVIFVEGGAEIDCTTRVYVDNLRLEIPAGVTLASGRGQYGSRGAMIFSDALTTRPLVVVKGGNVGITGLRIRGPDPKRRMDHHRRSFAEGRGPSYCYKFPVSHGIVTEDSGLEVDNCELAGWSHAAILLSGGGDHHTHHNYIHHNQYNGLGYGICLDTAEALIERNLFNFNRHSIAGTGRPGTSYEAAHNVEMGESLSYCFDMHGGEDRKDGTDIAGTWIKIHHNTFFPKDTHVIGIYGTPEQECQIYNNWFRIITSLNPKTGCPGFFGIRDGYGREGRVKRSTPIFQKSGVKWFNPPSYVASALSLIIINTEGSSLSIPSLDFDTARQLKCWSGQFRKI